MNYPLTVAEIRERRFQRDRLRVLSELERAAWHRRQIREEYERASRVYIKHLERLNKKMGQHVQVINKIATDATEVAARR